MYQVINYFLNFYLTHFNEQTQNRLPRENKSFLKGNKSFLRGSKSLPNGNKSFQNGSNLLQNRNKSIQNGNKSFPRGWKSFPNGNKLFLRVVKSKSIGIKSVQDWNVLTYPDKCIEMNVEFTPIEIEEAVLDPDD